MLSVTIDLGCRLPGISWQCYSSMLVSLTDRLASCLTSNDPCDCPHRFAVVPSVQSEC